MIQLPVSACMSLCCGVGSLKVLMEETVVPIPLDFGSCNGDMCMLISLTFLLDGHSASLQRV